MTPNKPIYASASHFPIEPLLNSPIIYKSFDKAEKRLYEISQRCILSKDSPTEIAEGLVLWIEGFQITEKEKPFRLGNFARISIYELPDHTCSLLVEKIDIDVKLHPQKVRIAHKHPNWGHPLLRGVLSKRRYAHLEQAQNELVRYQQQYPETTRIRDQNSLFSIIWSAKYMPSPVKKFVLQIVPDEAGFVIVANEPIPMDERVRSRAKIDEPQAYPYYLFASYLK